MLLIREFEINELVSFDDAIGGAVEDGFRLLGSGGAVNLPSVGPSLVAPCFTYFRAWFLGIIGLLGLRRT
ncbi:hypothetical protein [Vulcanisaeta distributa]|uniref:hypothetical protein n=1 Tax=Vulcanisaeta distributa TaxID=164451 RepID=UPI000ACE7CD1|nr:hypothetical protein [Vulcanisaeta distributa]